MSRTKAMRQLGKQSENFSHSKVKFNMGAPYYVGGGVSYGVPVWFLVVIIVLVILCCVFCLWFMFNKSRQGKNNSNYYYYDNYQPARGSAYTPQEHYDPYAVSYGNNYPPSQPPLQRHTSYGGPYRNPNRQSHVTIATSP
jgi:hypothetical protein